MRQMQRHDRQRLSLRRNPRLVPPRQPPLPKPSPRRGPPRPCLLGKRHLEPSSVRNECGNPRGIPLPCASTNNIFLQKKSLSPKSRDGQLLVGNFFLPSPSRTRPHHGHFQCVSFKNFHWPFTKKDVASRKKEGHNWRQDISNLP
jgi:hypothetical protein